MNRPHIEVRKSKRANYKPWVAVIRENPKSKRFWQMIFDTWDDAIAFALKDAETIHNETSPKEPQ